MFKQRLLTTLILVPLVLAALYYTTYTIFAVAALVLVAACSLEWLQLIPAPGSSRILFLLVMTLACYAIGLIWMPWLIAGMILWLVILFLLLQFPRSQTVWGRPWIVALFAVVLLPVFGQSLMHIFLLPHGRALIVYLLCLVWAADIGAYLAGKLWGRHKLIPAVSPGKTIEGVSGGLLLSFLVTVAGYYCLQPASALNWFIMSMATALISLPGDLFISMLKRRVSIKDTGHIFPGHGGVLDRLDSLIAAAPMFYFVGYVLMSA